MSEWKEYKINDIADIFDKKRVPLSKMVRAKREGQYPYYGASGIVDYINDYIFNGKYVLISEDGENLKSRQTPIAFNVKGKFWVNNHAHIIKGKKDFYNELIVYYFMNLDLNPYITGAVQPKLSKSNLQSIPIILPKNENQQKAIASILSSLDDKIDLLHRQNKTLESMAETLFRQWFIEEAQDDWEEVKLSSITDIAIGRTPPRKEFHWFSTKPNDIKWMSIKDLGENGVFIISTSEYLTKEAVETFNIPIIPEDTIVLSFKMTIGRVAITYEEMLSNEAIAHFIFNSNTPFSKEYLYFYLKLYNYQLLGSTSSIVTSINSSMIKDIGIVVPDTGTMIKFNNIVKPVFKKIKYNQIQVYELEQLRDILLPKLINGQINVNK